jgi:hypothetical protein
LVEHSPRHPKVKGFLAAPVADTWRKKVVEKFSSKIFVVVVVVVECYNWGLSKKKYTKLICSKLDCF